MADTVTLHWKSEKRGFGLLNPNKIVVLSAKKGVLCHIGTRVPINLLDV